MFNNVILAARVGVLGRPGGGPAGWVGGEAQGRAPDGALNDAGVDPAMMIRAKPRTIMQYDMTRSGPGPLHNIGR